MNDFYKEDYFGYVCTASCLIPHDHYKKYDHMIFTYPVFRVQKNFDTAWKLGTAQCLGVPYDQAKKALGI